LLLPWQGRDCSP